MSIEPDKRPITIVTACMKRDGSPTFAKSTVTATQDEVANGIHYYLAEAQLLEAGFEEPFVHFDQTEAPAFLHPAVRQHLGHLPANNHPTIAALAEDQ